MNYCLLALKNMDVSSKKLFFLLNNTCRLRVTYQVQLADGQALLAYEILRPSSLRKNYLLK